MAKTEFLGVPLSPEINAALTKAAQQEDRSKAWIVRRLIVGYLRRKGLLKKELDRKS